MKELGKLLEKSCKSAQLNTMILATQCGMQNGTKGWLKKLIHLQLGLLVLDMRLKEYLMASCSRFTRNPSKYVVSR